MKRSDFLGRRHSDHRGRKSCMGGFAYLWLLLLVALMGLGLTVAAQVDATAVQRDRERELLSIGRQFRAAIGRYYETQTTSGTREYPATFDDLIRDNRVPGIRRHLRQVAIDPMTHKAEWGLVMLGGRIAGVHSLSDKTPIKQDGFEPEDQALRGKSSYAEWVFTYPADLTLQSETGAAPKIEPPVLPASGATAAKEDAK
jgi:hypothetical protein